MAERRLAVNPAHNVRLPALHTCASMLIQAGATPVEVQRILGHSTPATTLNLYTHLLPDALDGVVGAPEVGDPRIRLRPGQVKGRTVIPLSREPGSMQAWKIVIPTTKVNPEPRAHDGREWIYVLSGRVRLVLGEEDWVLQPGDVAEFDRRSRTGSAVQVRRRRRC